MTAWTTGLLDDAAVLGGRALPPAVADHQRVRRGPDGAAVGALCVTERELPHLRTEDLPLHLAVTGGAGSLEAALRWVAQQPVGRVTLRRVSVRLRGEESPARNAQRVVAVLDAADLADDLEVRVAPTPDPVSPAWLAGLDELAAREVGLLLAATGDPAAVDAALDRELPVSFTAAGADDVVTAMRVVRTCLDGAPPDDDWLVADPDLAARTRRWCTSFTVPDLPAAAAALASAYRS